MEREKLELQKQQLFSLSQQQQQLNLPPPLQPTPANVPLLPSTPPSMQPNSTNNMITSPTSTNTNNSIIPPQTTGNFCAGCTLPIQSSGLQALDKSWHSECFVCTVCRAPLNGPFCHNDGKPYCSDDYQKLFAKRCAGCGNLIQGQFIRAMRGEWHPQGCFVCTLCKGTLSGGFFEKNTHPYCKDCVQKV